MPAVRARLLAALLCASLAVPAALPAAALAAPPAAPALQPLEATDAGDDIADATPLPASPVAGSLPVLVDRDDVYKVALTPGDVLTVRLDSPTPGAEILMSLWGPDTRTVNDIEGDPLAWDTIVAAGDARYPSELAFCAGSRVTYYLDVFSLSGGDYTLTYTITRAPVDIDRLEGAGRYQTAIAVSKAGWENGTSPHVVLATGQNFADALAASPLAGTYGCPILLTPTASLPADVLAEMKRLRGSAEATVHVVGSASAVSEAVASQLRGAGFEVDRVEGPTRYATAAAIAARVREHEVELGRTPSREAFVVNGLNYPDALSASPYAYRMRIPILLVTPQVLPPVTGEALVSAETTKAYVVGGPPAVSDAVVAALPVETAQRLAGPGRLTTMKAVVDHAYEAGWITDRSRVALATGWNYPDALGGGPLLGKWGAPLLLTTPNDLAPEPAEFFWFNSAEVETVRVLGSYRAVSDALFGRVVYFFGG